MKRNPLRRLKSAAGGVALLSAACGAASAADMTKLSVVLGYIPNVEMYGLEYALHEGLYKAEGLDVTLIPAGQGVNQVQMVAAGVVDVGIDNPEGIIAAAAKDESFKVFAGSFIPAKHPKFRTDQTANVFLVGFPPRAALLEAIDQS